VEKLAKKDEVAGFEKHVLKSGTMLDRLAAWAVMFQESPVSRLNLLQKLIKWANRKNHREKEFALKNLLALFTSDVMPQRMLKTTKERKWKKRISEKVCCMWYFEDEFKDLYGQFITALEMAAKDHMSWFRMKAIDMVTQLLERNPEQEKLLLMLLIHKLGDKDRKVCSATLRYIQRLLKKHPSMKGVVVKEVADLLKRNKNHRVKQYALVLISEFEFHATETEQQAATLCIRLYLDCFRENVINAENLTSKQMCALFTGIRRAFPYAEPDTQLFDSCTDAFYKIIHAGNFMTSVHTLLVLRQIEEASGVVSDRYYRALYALFVRPRVLELNKPHLFLHVVYKTLTNDKNKTRVCAFLKRIFQLCGHHSSPFTCGVFMLIGEVLNLHKELRDLFETSEAQALETFKDEITDEKEKKEDVEYLCRKLDPQYANATATPLWELSFLRCHYHPSAKVWIEKILDCEEIKFSGDPLTEFTTTAFLNRYSYKKPKKGQVKSTKFARKEKYLQESAIDLYDRENMPKNAVHDHDLFFHKYFAQRKALDPEIYSRRARREKEKREMKKEVDEDIQDDVMMETLKSLGKSQDVGGLNEDDWAQLQQMDISDDEGDEFAEEMDELDQFDDEDNAFCDAKEFAVLLAKRGIEE